jgi:hypothetical protein
MKFPQPRLHDYIHVMIYSQFRMSFLAIAVVAVLVALSGCSANSLGASTYIIGNITVSSGTLSGTGATWTLDAGTVPRYTTENVTFTVTNTGSAVFTATGTQSFTNSDFATNISGSFTVQPGASNTFIGSFTPTNASGQETGTLTLTPSSGTPIVINLKGTADQSFQILDVTLTQITNTSTIVTPFGVSCSTLLHINNAGSSTITLTSNPYVIVSGSAIPYVSATQPTLATIAGSTSEPFHLGAAGGQGIPGVVTITGTDSATGAPFTFSFSVTSVTSGC